MKLICWFCKKPIEDEDTYVFMDHKAKIKKFSCLSHPGANTECSYCVNVQEEIKNIQENVTKYTIQHISKD